MKVTEVAFGFTKNMGNYQSARAEVKIELEEGEDPVEAMNEAKEFVAEQLGLDEWELPS